MKNILSFNEFINEDYRDVVGCGSGGIHNDDMKSLGVAGMGGNTTLSTLGDPSGETKVLGTEEIKMEDPYFGDEPRKKAKKFEIEEEKKKRMRKNQSKFLLNIDKNLNK